MMLRNLGKGLLLFLFVLSFSVTVTAQSPDPAELPIIALDRDARGSTADEVLRVQTDGVYRRIFSGERIQNIVRSPDGQFVVVEDVDPDILAQFGFGIQDSTVNDLWLVDVANGTSEQVTMQPPTDNLLETQGIGSTTGPSVAWSPDSTAFAYIRQPYGNQFDFNTPQLIIYDVASAQATVIVELEPIQVGYRLYWLPQGLLLTLDVNDPDADLESGFRLYAPDGTLVTEQFMDMNLTGMNGEPAVLVQAPIFYQGEAYLGLHTPSTSDGVFNDITVTQLIDVTTGEIIPVDAPLLIGSGTAESTRWLYGVNRVLWLVFDSDYQFLGALSNAPPYDDVETALSPDGQQVAFTAYGARRDMQEVKVWSNDAASSDLPASVPAVEVLWASPVYTIGSDNMRQTIDAALDTYDAAACGGIDSRLQPGGRGTVLPSTPNNLRESPSRTSEILGQIQVGEQFLVSPADPVCVDGVRFWQVIFEGQQGWTAENDGETYFVAPVP